jgi:hypothetical protein
MLGRFSVAQVSGIVSSIMLFAAHQPDIAFVDAQAEVDPGA